MPNEFIEQENWLSAVAEKYEGIVFKDINGKILTDQFNEEVNEDRDIESTTTIDEQTTGVDAYTIET